MEMYVLFKYALSILNRSIPKPSIKKISVNSKFNNSSYYSGEFDILKLCTLTNSSKLEEEDIISKGYENVTYRIDQNVDLGIVDLAMLNNKKQDEITKITSKTTHSLNASKLYTNLVNRLEIKDLLNPGKVGALSIGTLIYNSPLNKKDIRGVSEYTNDLDLDKGDYLHFPVSKKEKEREDVLRTSDACRFIFAPSIVNDTGADDFDFRGPDALNIPFLGPTAEHISGVQFWYKDHDNIPSVIRPINFSNYVSLFSDYTLNTSLRYIQGANKSYWDYGKCCDYKSDSLNTDNLIIKTDIFNRISKAFRNKIVVTEFKRINTTMNREAADYKCPILEGYLNSGYRVVDNNSLQTIMEDFYNYVITNELLKRSERRNREDILNSLFVQSRGRRLDYEKDILDFKAIIQNKGKVSFKLYQPKQGEPGYACGHMLYATPVDIPNVVPGLWNRKEEDFEHFGNYSIGSYEVKRIVRDQDLGIIIANSIYNKSICLVKHTIIDLSEDKFKDSDSFYDIETNLLIGKIYKDRDKTIKALVNNQHPSYFKIRQTESESIRYKYVIHGNSRLPDHVYINVNGYTMKLKSELDPSKEEGVYIIVNNSVNRHISPERFSYDGIFVDKNDCDMYTRFGDHYRSSITSGLVDVGRENELLRRELENTRYHHDIRKIKLEGMLLSKEEEVTNLKFELIERKHLQELELLAQKGKISKQEFVQKLIELQRKSNIHSLNVAEDVIDATLRFATLFDKISKRI